MNLPPLPAHAHAQPLLPAQGAVELLFLLFHGAGAHAGQMDGLAQALRAQYPQAAIVALDAPLRLPAEAIDGFQWFDETDQGPDARSAGVAAALPGFVATVRQWAEAFALDWPRVALGGFSQGGLMALEAVQANGSGPMLVNSSRAILYAGRSLADFAQQARAVALATRDQLQAAR